ncbi:MAG TPA: glycosyltransferase, partial [Devosia sp.]|nr:glycosyltransferase [Devosia sp.]
HATTYRGLIKGLAELGHDVLFLERDVEWYRSHRDLADPAYCALAYYESLGELISRFGDRLRRADAVIIGSYVPEGVDAIDAIAALKPRRLCFYDIDTPVTLAKLRDGREEYLAARQIPLFDLYLSFTGGPTLERLERYFGARRAEAFHCSADADLYSPIGGSKRWDLGYLGTYSPDRQPTLERLLLEPARRLPRMRFVVAGPQYPAGIDWPANVERIDHLPPAEHPAFYNRQRFTLNVTRADMIAAGWSPSVRLFEAAACATPIISDFWPGLTDLLPDGEAVLVARTPDDVVAALTGMSEAERRRLGRAARNRILAGHTGSARARQFVRLLEDLPAGPVGATRSRLIEGVMG